jgi:hypothetical protein
MVAVTKSPGFPAPRQMQTQCVISLACRGLQFMSVERWLVGFHGMLTNLAVQCDVVLVRRPHHIAPHTSITQRRCLSTPHTATPVAMLRGGMPCIQARAPFEWHAAPHGITQCSAMRGCSLRTRIRVW